MGTAMGIEWFQIGEIGRCLSFSAFSAKTRASLVPNLIIVVCLYQGTCLSQAALAFRLIGGVFVLSCP
jgi:hypothetical protein